MQYFKISLIQAMILYLDDCQLNEQSPRTLEGKQSTLRMFIRWHIMYHGAALSTVTKATLDEFKRYLLDYRNPQTNRLLDKSTRRNKITVLKTFCQTMYEMELLAENPADKIRIPKAPKRIMKSILQQDEVFAIANQTQLHGDKGVRDCAILGVLFACGLRRNEITKLTMNSLNAKAKTLFIEQGKGEKDRIVPIAQGAITLLQLYLTHIRPKLMTFESGNALFIDNRGKPYNGGQITALVSRYKARAGVMKPGASNLYRHTTATTMLDNGADLRVIQEILGHASISTTQIYTHVAVRKMCNEYQSSHPAAINNASYTPVKYLEDH
jgi:integrase/recombinase XerD